MSGRRRSRNGARSHPDVLGFESTPGGPVRDGGEPVLKTKMPGLLTTIGGALIASSGIVSLVVALTFGAVFYEVDPNGLFGHVGIVAGVAAMAIGAFLFWFGHFEHRTAGRLLLAGAVSIVLGHLGAIAGALLIGTAGVLCCYVAGVWFIVRAIRIRRLSRKEPE